MTDAPVTNFGAVFEDDGQTGYFYALDRSRKDMPILDAVHIYNAENVTDRERPSVFQIVWTADGTKTALYINDYPHAVFRLLRLSWVRQNELPASE